MTTGSPAAELPQNSSDDAMELNKDLERMIEDTENISVQLTWMAYDVVALRTSPELVASLRSLEEAHDRCRAAVSGDLKPQSDKYPEPTTKTLTQM
ncbi:hypothetical protein PAMA_017578 [Pampus argenteus]